MKNSNVAKTSELIRAAFEDSHLKWKNFFNFIFIKTKLELGYFSIDKGKTKINIDKI